MHRWYNQLPRAVRLLFVLLLYGCVFIAHVAGVNYYVTHLSEKVDSKEVIVASRDIPLHTIITMEDIMVKRIRYGHLVSGAISDVDEVVGREAQTQIVHNEQLNPAKLNSAVKLEGEMIVEVPVEWGLSFPKSLRRLDKLSFLPVLQTALQPTLQNNQTSQTSDEQAHSTEDAGGALNQDTRSNELLEKAETLLKHITVAYFKDNSANEVVDSLDNNQDSSPRLRSSNLGARLEVAMSEEQWVLFRELRLKQYKFVISYE